MMEITVRFGEPLRKTVGARRIALQLPENATAADLIARLAQTYPGFNAAFRGDDLGRDHPYILFVSGKPVTRPNYAQTRLRHGDVVHIVMPVVGGSATAPLPRTFYARPAPEVAPNLLGQILVRELDGRRLAGRIVEVEAYLGPEDAASHAFRGPTPRNRSMFGPPGRAYVYLIYGMHHCLNIVTGPEGEGQAVLIRALEPLEGVDVMRARRGPVPDRQLTNGPGKLCQALAIDRRLDGHDLCLGETLWLEPGPPPEEAICAGPRVGVRGDALALHRAWRFYLKGHPYVSPAPQNRVPCSVP